MSEESVSFDDESDSLETNSVESNNGSDSKSNSKSDSSSDSSSESTDPKTSDSAEKVTDGATNGTHQPNNHDQNKGSNIRFSTVSSGSKINRKNGTKISSKGSSIRRVSDINYVKTEEERKIQKSRHSSIMMASRSESSKAIRELAHSQKPFLKQSLAIPETLFNDEVRIIGRPSRVFSSSDRDQTPRSTRGLRTRQSLGGQKLRSHRKQKKKKDFEKRKIEKLNNAIAHQDLKTIQKMIKTKSYDPRFMFVKDKVSSPLHYAFLQSHILLDDSDPMGTPDVDKWVVENPVINKMISILLDLYGLGDLSSFLMNRDHKEHHTVVHILAIKGDTHAIYWLFKVIMKTQKGHSLDPDIRDIKGRSALHWAAKHGHARIVLDLLMNNAAPDIRDYKGLTPVDFARPRTLR
eukprot:TRINITY_DN3513_c0_g1_i2.p1 TRINITY_DN3513_c0_g1~~TRINITY_DN3513_c0_g1_i2.p1  ORF type:complete len:407 (+),score=43.52 TRINITY_DN3513_c0_g1_i2:103-1323(+)